MTAAEGISIWTAIATLLSLILGLWLLVLRLRNEAARDNLKTLDLLIQLTGALKPKALDKCQTCHGDGLVQEFYTDGTPSRTLGPCPDCGGAK